MTQRSIGQERFGFAGRERAASSLDMLVSLIDWIPVAVLLDPLYPAAKGQPACFRSGRIEEPIFSALTVHAGRSGGRGLGICCFGGTLVLPGVRIRWR